MVGPRGGDEGQGGTDKEAVSRPSSPRTDAKLQHPYSNNCAQWHKEGRELDTESLGAGSSHQDAMHACGQEGDNVRYLFHLSHRNRDQDDGFDRMHGAH